MILATNENILFHQRLIPNYQIALMERFCEKFPNTKIIYGNEKKNEPLNNARIQNPHFFKIKNFYPLKQPSFFYSPVLKAILKSKPKIVITQGSIGNLSLLTFFLLRPFFNYKIILWGHGWNRKKNNSPGNSSEDKYRLFVQRKSNAIVLYSEKSKIILENYIDKKKLFVANNTLDTTELTEIYNSLLKLGKNAVKEELNIKQQFNIVFLGRLVVQKNLMLLVQLMNELKSSNIGLHFIGDGPESEKLGQFCNAEGLDRVYFHGELTDSIKIGKFLFSSDLMIIPRSVGLSAIHSFAFGLPVMVLENVAHGPEIDFITDTANGFIEFEKPIKEVAQDILNFFSNSDLQKKFSKNSRRVIEESVNTNNFLTGFEKAIKFASIN